MATKNQIDSPLSGTTGTGNFVGSTSPTLVTPLLGTPTSGIFTNCTGYPTSALTVLPFITITSQVFTASGTYTPTAGMKYCLVELCGAGAGGGGCAGGGGGTCGSGDSGSGGGYARKIFSAATIGASQTVTINAAGTGGAAGANVGGNGGSTTFGALLSATGGTGGTGRTADSAGAVGGSSSRNGPPGIGSGGDINILGGNSSNSISLPSGAYTTSGQGGGSYFCPVGAANSRATGNAAEAGFAPGAGSYGCGGSGGSTAGTGGDIAGGAGLTGIVVITEFL